MNSIFNSMSEEHKSPFGSVMAGTSVSMSLTPHRSLSVCGGMITAVCESSATGVEVPLNWSGLSGQCDIFSGTIDTTGFVGPVWYSFQLFTIDGRTLYIGRSKGGEGVLFPSYPHDNLFQMTVYESSYHVPEWYGEGITYQIFLDRFRRGRPSEQFSDNGERRLNPDWGACPAYRPDQNNIWNDEFFGGNFSGIIEKLPYLKKLNVCTIYLNPIFESVSSHRYDTGDYMKADPLLGSNEEFRRLCGKARALGMRVMLDGVFSHTGYNSIYFNALGKYPSVGAAQSKDSPYYGWYTFDHWPDKYSAWWGVYSLPQVDETNESYRDFIYRGRDSVIRYWMRLGVSAWRLDVADELPDAFIEELRESMRKEDPESVLIGEVWEDASNKISYSARRRYFWGRELDGVMNYPFRDGLIAYLRGGNAEDFRDILEAIRENYPEQAFRSLMNHIGTHDTVRALTILGTEDVSGLSRDQKASYHMPQGDRERGMRLLKLASLVQYTFPGSPCVYYGDEAGMEGFEDPFNRRGYPWGGENRELLDWYVRLGELRVSHEALRKGGIRFVAAKGPLLAFERTYKDQTLMTLVNRSGGSVMFDVQSDDVEFFDIINGRPVEFTDDESGYGVAVPPFSGMLLLKKKVIAESPDKKKIPPFFGIKRLSAYTMRK